jgi:hypothetical protein
MTMVRFFKEMKRVGFGFLFLVLLAGLFFFFRNSHRSEISPSEPHATPPQTIFPLKKKTSVGEKKSEMPALSRPENSDSPQTDVTVENANPSGEKNETSPETNEANPLTDPDAPLKDKVPEGKWKRAYWALRTKERDFCGSQDGGWILTSLAEEDYYWESQRSGVVVFGARGKAPDSTGELNTCGTIQIPPIGEKVRLRIKVLAPVLGPDASIHLRAMSKNWTLLQESEETLVRSTNWTSLQIFLEIPPETDQLIWGIKLKSAGKVLVKDAILRRYL